MDICTYALSRDESIRWAMRLPRGTEYKEQIERFDGKYCIIEHTAMTPNGTIWAWHERAMTRRKKDGSLSLTAKSRCTEPIEKTETSSGK